MTGAGASLAGMVRRFKPVSRRRPLRPHCSHRHQPDLKGPTGKSPSATEQVAGNSEDSSLKPGRNAEERHFDEEVQGRDALQLQKYIPPPQKRGQAGGCAAGADIQHRGAAEGATPADGGGAPSTATGVKGRTAAARQG